MRSRESSGPSSLAADEGVQRIPIRLAQLLERLARFGRGRVARRQDLGPARRRPAHRAPPWSGHVPNWSFAAEDSTSGGPGTRRCTGPLRVLGVGLGQLEGTEHHRHRAQADPCPVTQRRGLVDAGAVHERAVPAVQVLELRLPVADGDARVAPRDGPVVDPGGGLGRAAEDVLAFVERDLAVAPDQAAVRGSGRPTPGCAATSSQNA